MPKILSEEAVKAYHRDGYYAPVRVMSEADAARYRAALETHEAKTGAPLQSNWRHKTHLLFTWADELVHHPRILDAVEDAIGPDILCWTSTFFIKEKKSPGFVSWHQDSTYWGLDPADVIGVLQGVDCDVKPELVKLIGVAKDGYTQSRRLDRSRAGQIIREVDFVMRRDPG